jgi:trans-aconitate 2-methyltransferase
MRWDPDQYLRFADERGRPFRDLLARIPATTPAQVVDLGCGPGNLTSELAERWPRATVQGIDLSPHMIEWARGHSRPDVRFAVGDLVDWEPAEPVDVLLTNATLQWIPGHLTVIDRLAGFVRPGGWFAFQVPGNFAEPSHTELAALCALPPWRDLLSHARMAAPRVEQPDAYLSHLLKLGFQADVWKTTYYHVLSGPDPVLEWMRGTALRPVLSQLSSHDVVAFEADFGARLCRAYPQQPFGTVLPFPRIFAVARRLVDNAGISG